jgi:hypothetical protein
MGQTMTTRTQFLALALAMLVGALHGPQALAQAAAARKPPGAGQLDDWGRQVIRACQPEIYALDQRADAERKRFERIAYTPLRSDQTRSGVAFSDDPVQHVVAYWLNRLKTGRWTKNELLNIYQDVNPRQRQVTPHELDRRYAEADLGYCLVAAWVAYEFPEHPRTWPRLHPQGLNFQANSRH